MNPDILLTHARGASKGVGAPFVNSNNHPFVNSDKSIGLIHNGRVSDCQYRTLKKRYEVSSGCDSEILLRIFEHAHLNSNKNDTSGFMNIWSQVLEAHMAIAVGEKTSKHERRLWISRNEHRPNWVVDLRKQLGQLFFVSTPEIWAEAVDNCSLLKNFIKKFKMVELPTEEIWRFKLSENNKIDLSKFKVHFEGTEEWDHTESLIPIVKNTVNDEIYSNLDESENVIKKYKPNPGKLNTELDRKVDPVFSSPEKCEEIDCFYSNGICTDKDGLERICDSIKSIKFMLEDIETLAENKLIEGSMEESEMLELLYALESTGVDLNGTLRILKQ